MSARPAGVAWPGTRQFAYFQAFGWIVHVFGGFRQGGGRAAYFKITDIAAAAAPSPSSKMVKHSMANQYVTVIWEARSKVGREAEMKAFLTGVITSSRNDPGCIDYEFHEVVGSPGTFIAYERWEDQAALDGHLNGPRMLTKGAELRELMDGSIEEGLRILRPFRPVE